MTAVMEFPKRAMRTSLPVSLIRQPPGYTKRYPADLLLYVGNSRPVSVVPLGGTYALLPPGEVAGAVPPEPPLDEPLQPASSRPPATTVIASRGCARNVPILITSVRARELQINPSWSACGRA